MPKRFISNQVLIEVLKQATEDEKLSLSKLVDDTNNKALSPKLLQEEICSIGGDTLGNLSRLGDGNSYLDILNDVAKELSIKKTLSYFNKMKYFDDLDSLNFDNEKSKNLGLEYAERLEEEVILKLLEIAYNKMPSKDKQEFDEQICIVTKKFDSNMKVNLTGVAGLMTLGKLGGFTTYTLLTTSLSTLSVGTLGFTTYAGATSLLSIILGPVGWAGLGTIAILTLGQANTQKLIPIVATIGAIRQRIKYERQMKNG